MHPFLCRIPRNCPSLEVTLIAQKCYVRSIDCMLQWCAFKPPSPQTPSLSPSARSSCLLNICHPPAMLDYATSCPTGQEPRGEKCVTCRPWRVSNLLLCADHKELAPICLPTPCVFNKIHSNTNTSLLPSPAYQVNSAQCN